MSDALFSVFAVQAAGPEANPLSLFFPFILVFAVMYFFILRPQQKQRRELQQMVEALKKETALKRSAASSAPLRGFRRIMWFSKPETVTTPRWSFSKRPSAP